jgi:hypothetical protein
MSKVSVEVQYGLIDSPKPEEEFMRHSLLIVTTIVLSIWMGLTSASAQNLSDFTKNKTPHSPTEQWVLSKIFSGEAADLSIYCKNAVNSGDSLDSTRNDSCLILSSEFINNILFENSQNYKSPLHMFINGAHITGKIDLTFGHYKGEIFLTNCLFDENFRFELATVDGALSLSGSTFRKGINLSRISIEETLFLDNVTVVDGDLNISRSKIGQDVWGTRVRVAGLLDISNTNISGDLLLYGDGHVGGKLNTSFSHIGGSFNICGSSFDQGITGQGMIVSADVCAGGGAVRGAPFNMDRAHIGGLFIMANIDIEQGFVADSIILSGGMRIYDKSVIHRTLQLPYAQVTGWLVISDTIVDGTLVTEGMVENGEIEIRDSKVNSDSILVRMSIAGSLDLSGSEFHSMALSGSNINGTLRLGSPVHNAVYSNAPKRAKWEKNAFLKLNGTHVGSWEDMEDDSNGNTSWPSGEESLSLDGFTYDRLGSVNDLGHILLMRRDPQWFVKLFERDRSFSQATYQRLANIFRAAGDPSRADKILYAARERERREVWRDRQYSTWMWLTILKWTIFYGLESWYLLVLFWLTLFTLVGAFVLYKNIKKEPEKGFVWCIGASLDRLIPVVDLNKEFSEYFHDPNRVRLTDWQCRYFAFHIIIGYAFTSFILVALAGLTQSR